MRIDSHQHYWRLARGDYGWLTPAHGAIYRDIAPAELAPQLSAGRIDGTVLVQAAASEAETEFLLGIAHATPSVLGVVGWVDFVAPDAPARIAARARDKLLVSLRPMLHDLDDPDWVARPALDAAFDALVAQDLAFDALVRPAQLPGLLRRLERHPALRVVVDHGGKPAIATGAWEPWAGLLRAAAAHPTVHCKLSGLLTEAAPGAGDAALRRYSDHLLACFGAARLLWGSDWPVLERHGDYAGWLGLAEALCDGLTPPQRAGVFGGNAARCYRLEARPC